MAERLVVEVVGDSSNFERTLKRSSREAKKFEATIGSVGRRAFGGAAGALGLAVGLDRLVGGIKSSIDAASDLNEQVSRSKVIFRSSAGAMAQWSRSSVQSAGLSQRAALDAASSYGTLLTAAGQSADAAAENSRALVQVAADLRSISNTDMEQTLDAIRSGLVGEADPLQRFGILLSESRVQAEALAQTGKRTAASLTEQEKVTARLALIQRGAAYAAGNFRDTSGELANQSQMLTARLENLRVKIGNQLTPAATEIAKRLNAWLSNQRNVNRLTRNSETIFRDTAAAAIVLAQAVGAAANAYTALRDAQKSAERTLGPLGFLTKSLPWAVRAAARNAQDVFDIISGKGLGGGGTAGAPPGLAGPLGRPTRRGTPPGMRGPVTAAGRRPRGAGGGGGISAADRNLWFDATIGRMLGRVGDATSLRGQIARLREIAGLVRERLSVTRDITRRLTLEDQLADIQRDIRDRESQIAANARDRERERKRNERLRKERDAERKRKRERQARIREERKFTLGMEWLEFAAERAEVTKTIADDLRIARRAEKRIQDRIRQEGRTLELVRRLWAVRDKIRELNKSKADTDPLAGLVQVSSRRMARALAAGTGLSVAGRRILEANIAAQEISVNLNLDGQTIASSVNRANARTAHRTSRQTSGWRGG
jgi:hypothetical protein